MDFVYVTPLTNAMILDCMAGGSITYKDLVFVPGGSSALYLVRQHVTVMWVLMANGSPGGGLSQVLPLADNITSGDGGLL